MIKRKTHSVITDNKTKCITLTIDYEGEASTAQDVLTMIADSWCFDLSERGLDPVKTIQNMAAINKAYRKIGL